MKTGKYIKISRLAFIFVVLLLAGTSKSFAQRTTFSIALDPAITWFSNDRQEIDTKGARGGFAYGLVVDHFFGEKYALSTGVGISHINGTITYSDTVPIRTSYDTVYVPGGTPMNYNLTYLYFPMGLKLKTVEIGYKTFYVDLGIKAMFRLKATAATDNNILQKNNINDETNLFNMLYYVGAGMEYSLGGNTALIFGFYYSRTFLDITTDILNKPPDHLNANILSLRLGVLF